MIRLIIIIKNIFGFGDGNERTNRAKKNITGSLIIKGSSIAIGIVLTPLTLHYINPTEYGIWVTLSSIIAWLSFFDIGLGNGLRNKFSEAITNGNVELARIYVSTTYAIISIIILVVLLIFLCINPFLDWTKILNTPPNMGSELSTLALIVFIFFCIGFVLKFITTILTADQKPAKASFFDLLGKLFSLLIVFVLTKTTTGSLLYLGLALSITPVLVLASSSLWFYNHEYRKYAPSFKYVQFKYARDLLTLGANFFMIQIAVIILYQTNAIIIAQLFGPDQVTPYSIAYRYFGLITMVFSIIMLPFWSAFTEAWIKKDNKWIKKTIKNLKQLWLLFSIITIGMVFSANFIYRIWVGKEIIIPITLSITLALYVIINAWCAIYSHFLNGVGKIRLQLYFSFLQSVFNIPLAIFLGKNIGISGVIISSIIFGFIGSIWAPLQYYKIINNKAFGIWGK